MKQYGGDEYQRFWTTEHQSLLENAFPAFLFNLQFRQKGRQS
jgi:hypothetical protein